MSYTTKDWYASLERLDVEKGYTRDNIVLCCLEFNSRSQWSPDKIIELISLCDEARQNEASLDMFQKRKKANKPVVPTIIDGITYYQCCGELKKVDDYPPARNGQCNICRNAVICVYQCTPRGSLKRLIRSAKLNTKQRDTRKHTWVGDFEIDFDHLVTIYLQQQGLCFYSGIPLAFGHYTETRWKCSLERKDASKGYTKENVCLICHEFQSTDQIVCFKNKGQGGSGWNTQKFVYYLDHAREKYKVWLHERSSLPIT